MVLLKEAAAFLSALFVLLAGSERCVFVTLHSVLLKGTSSMLARQRVPSWVVAFHSAGPGIQCLKASQCEYVCGTGMLVRGLCELVFFPPSSMLGVCVYVCVKYYTWKSIQIQAPHPHLQSEMLPGKMGYILWGFWWCINSEYLL